MDDFTDALSKCLTIVGHGIGEECVDGEIGIKGAYMDAYLLLMVLKEFIDIGDIEIKFSDKIKSKSVRVNYLNELVDGVKKLDIEEEKKNRPRP